MPTAIAPLLHVGARLSWTEFTVHPSTVVGVVALATLYIWRAAAHRPADAPHRRGQAVAFGAALLLLLFVLNGWLHDLSDGYLFSAHMVQHLVLAMVVAPLFLMGTPGWMLRPVLRHARVAAMARWLTRAPICFAAFNVVLVGWHLPPLYNAAMAHHGVHIVQHLMLLAAAVGMWWPVLSPLPELPRLSYPGQMLYLFLMTIPMSIVSVAIAYADSVLYPWYASAPRVLHLSPMQDQLLGGLVMWIPGGLYIFAVISVIFFRWQRLDSDSQSSAQADLAAASG